MRIVTVMDKTTETKATKIYNILCRHNKPFNECVMTYMGGNKFKKNSFNVGIEIECPNKVTELVLYSINTAKKYLILGNILK